MTEMKKTVAFVGVAVVLMGTAVLATRPKIETAEAFSDQGEEFFPEFKDPFEATALEVIDYDAETASALPFKVMLEDGRWVIPSHHDYPADAKDRLAKTAAGVMDLTKDVIVSDRADLHEEMGVIDPLDTKTPSLKGRGKRVTLKNKSGETLADFIIGKPVPGQENQRFVRVPGQKRTYAVNVNVDLSARFADWIETNLLQLQAGDIRRVTIDNHKVDPEQGTVTPAEVVTIEREADQTPWTLDGGVPPGKELDTTKINELTSALADLKIVGVRTKPEGLTKELKATKEGTGISLDNEAIRSLQSRGFYVLRDGRLLSNQGDVIAFTDQGIVYTLRFGEVTFASGEALSAGSEKEAAEAKSEEESSEGATESRYLFVTAEFDPDLVPKPEGLPDETNGELPEHLFERTAEQIKADAQQAESAKAQYERTLEQGREKARELTDRFAEWYYVVPGDAFRQIVLSRDALLREPSPAGGGTPPPTLPPGFNLPSGMPHP